LEKVTDIGGFHLLPKEETDMLAKFSRLAEGYEDSAMQLIPIRPKTLREAVSFKMAEQKLTQAPCQETRYWCAKALANNDQ
jgi:hypothetical protein